jgi:hypothetical protein
MYEDCFSVSKLNLSDLDTPLFLLLGNANRGRSSTYEMFTVIDTVNSTNNAQTTLNKVALWVG